MLQSPPPIVDMEYDVGQVLWRSPDSDRGTALLHIMRDDFKVALRAMHRHVILRNALRRRQNLAQILLLVGFGGGFSEVFPVDDIVAEVIKEGAAGDGDLQVLCHWNLDRFGRHVFPHQPGRLMEAKRIIKLEDLRKQSGQLIACVDDCATEADQKGGTWLLKRASEFAS